MFFAIPILVDTLYLLFAKHNLTILTIWTNT